MALEQSSHQVVQVAGAGVHQRGRPAVAPAADRRGRHGAAGTLPPDAGRSRARAPGSCNTRGGAVNTRDGGGGSTQETERSTQETGRSTQETGRSTQETERSTQETQRSTQETERGGQHRRRDGPHRRRDGHGDNTALDSGGVLLRDRVCQTSSEDGHRHCADIWTAARHLGRRRRTTDGADR